MRHGDPALSNGKHPLCVTCPDCGARLVRRYRYDNPKHTFWACPNFRTTGCRFACSRRIFGEACAARRFGRPADVVTKILRGQLRLRSLE